MAVQIALRNTPSTAVMTTKMTRLMQDLSVVLVGRDAANVAKAKRRTLDTLPVIVGFTVGCGRGATGEAVAGPWSLFLPTALALLALIGMAPLAMTETRP
jgi:uncharacterized membrane protein YoaK (UPF0700 family)